MALDIGAATVAHLNSSQLNIVVESMKRLAGRCSVVEPCLGLGRLKLG